MQKQFTFKDLIFVPHAFHTNGKHATLTFENNYGISVITGPRSYTSKKRPYEVAILYNGSITYDTSLTDDVLGYQTKNDIDDIIKEVQTF